ncbi:MAG: glycogen/starch synthase, partial [Desulfobacterales bacterium]|nr:glycogen/starch synthase [Desulfobacterales bacterium]
LEVPLGDKTLPCDVLETRTSEGILVYFFDREDLFDRANLYGNQDGDYPDNLERFAYFSRAALVLQKSPGFVSMWFIVTIGKPD